MGNENERKRNPADNRKRQMGHDFDDVKTDGDETNVGITNDRGLGERGAVSGGSVGSVGIVGGSAEFLTDEEESTGQGGDEAGSRNAAG